VFNEHFDAVCLSVTHEISHNLAQPINTISCCYYIVRVPLDSLNPLIKSTYRYAAYSLYTLYATSTF